MLHELKMIRFREGASGVLDMTSDGFTCKSPNTPSAIEGLHTPHNGAEVVSEM